MPNVQSHLLRDDGRFPNHPRWPLIIYPAALSFTTDDPAGEIERLFQRNGWGGMWRNGIYPFQHYHSAAHEVLGVFRGTVRVQFGGPQGIEAQLSPGDVAILPAGVAHKNLGSSADLGVVGAYPPGQDADLCRGEASERARALQQIPGVPRPGLDPVLGREGGLLNLWPE